MNREQPIGSGKKDKLIKELKSSDKHVGKDLRKELLFELDLSRKDFSKSDLSGSNLRGTNLTGCNLKNVDLTGADLEGAWLRSADLEGAKRDGQQILDHAGIYCKGQHYYAFMVQGKGGKSVLINEPGKPEYVFVQGKASQMGALLYNLLVNG